MTRSAYLVSILILAGIGALYAGKTETLEQILARAKTAKPAEQVSLYLDAAQRQLTAADQLFTEGKVEEAQAAVKDVVTYSGNAAQATLQSRKKLTTTEIAIRKMSQRLHAIKRTLTFDDQPPVEDAADKLEKMRTDLLSAMFQKE